MKNNKEKFHELIDNIIENGCLDRIDDDGAHILRYVEIYIAMYEKMEVPLVYKSLNNKTVGVIEIDPELWSKELVMRVENRTKKLIKEKEVDDKLKAQEKVLDTIGVFSNEMLASEHKVEEDIKKEIKSEKVNKLKIKKQLCRRVNMFLRGFAGVAASIAVASLHPLFMITICLISIPFIVDFFANYYKSSVVGAFLKWDVKDCQIIDEMDNHVGHVGHY